MTSFFMMVMATFFGCILAGAVWEAALTWWENRQ